MLRIAPVALWGLSFLFVFFSSNAFADSVFVGIVPEQDGEILIHEFVLDETPLNRCPMARAESDEICSEKNEGETDYEWLRRVEKAATADAKAKFAAAYGSDSCPAENGECLKCRGSGPMKKGTCKLLGNQTKPSEIPGTRSTTHDDQTNKVCSQVSVGCSYTCSTK